MIKSDTDLLQEINSICQEEQEPVRQAHPEAVPADHPNEDIFNVSNILLSKHSESDLNPTDGAEINNLINQFTKVEIRLMEEILDNMKCIVKEDEQILEYFMTKVPKCQSVDEVTRFLEALYYEQKIRINDKLKIVDRLRSSLDKQMNSFKNADSIIKRCNLSLLSEL